MLTSDIPGPASSVLQALLVADPNAASQQMSSAVFSSLGEPDLPSLITEVVPVPLSGQYQGNLNVNGLLAMQGFATQGVQVITAAYTTLPTDALIFASASGGALVVTLADATQAGFTTGQRYTVVKVDNSSNAVTLTGSNGQLIAGNANLVLNGANAYTTVAFDGANWQVIGGYSVVGSGTGVTSVTAADTSVVVAGTTSAPTVRTNTLDVIAADHPPAANWSNNSKKITSLANGTAAQDAVAFGQTAAGGNTVTIAHGGTGQTTASAALTALGGLTLQQATAVAGYTLVNGTGNIVTWTPPSDGALHQFMVVAVLHVTSAETGGSIQITWTVPDGTSTTTSVFAGGQSGVQSFSQSKLCQAGTAVTVQQNTALTAGAAVAWVQLWGL